jgi:hypothetical protein
MVVLKVSLMVALKAVSWVASMGFLKVDLMVVLMVVLKAVMMVGLVH